MPSQQLEDLPQIQYMHETRLQSWSSSCYDYLYADKHQPVGFSVMEDSLGIDCFDDSMMSMQPMQRFMYDQSPQTMGLLHANIPLQNQYQKQYIAPWPSAEYGRNASPDRTSVSGTSSYASPNEMPSPYAYNTVSYGSPVDSFLPSMPYHTSEQFSDVVCPSGTSGTSISLKEIEYDHQEPEPTIEEADNVDIKFEPTIVSEQVAVKTDNDPSAYREYTDSGIGNSVRDAESVQPVDCKHESDEDSEYSPTSKYGKRRRSAPHSSRAPRRRGGVRKDSVTSTTSPHKPGRKPRGTLNFKADSKYRDDCRPFPCPLAAYNCTSTFSSKNEWKRHVSTQHIKLGFWRCDLCPPTPDANDASELYYNDFNRKDLFTQHLRRMHAAQGSGARHNKVHPVTEENIGEHQTRCHRQLRRAPQQSICPFNGCNREFVGPASWEERMEHVGRHLEKDRRDSAELLNSANWKRDAALEQYLVDEGLIAWEHGAWKTSDGKSRRAGSDSSDED
ncbi:C2H2 finger domain-containing protein [Stagonosporopsis vannaccii]|nr:C2H2 finger domain-containing protein [Stagonosporopsis vannaccii]